MNNGYMPAMPPNAGWEHPQAKGLTKREYFAGLAMQGLLADKVQTQRSVEELVVGYSELAVKFADALLAELEK